LNNVGYTLHVMGSLFFTLHDCLGYHLGAVVHYTTDWQSALFTTFQ